MYQCWLEGGGCKQLVPIFAEKDLYILVHKLGVCLQCVLAATKANCILSCNSESSQHVWGSDPCPLFDTCESPLE